MKIDITKKDIIWGYFAQFFSMASGLLVLPFILRLLTPEEIGMNYLMLTVGSMVSLFDFGFAPQFGRNFSYIFSGAQVLHKEGVELNNAANRDVNYRLLSTMIGTAKSIYQIISIVVLVVMLTLGTLYIHKVTHGFSNVNNSLLIWIVYSVSTFFNVYYTYYTSLLTGQGKIMESKKAMVYSKLVYIFLVLILLFTGVGLLGVCIANLIAPFVSRYLSYRYFFTADLKNRINEFKVSKAEKHELFSIIWYNSKKLGLVFIGAYAITRFSMFLAGLYLPLAEISSYGLMTQLTGIILTIAGTLFQIMQPTLSSHKVNNNKEELLKTFSFTMGIMYTLFILGGVFLVYIMPTLLTLVKSNVLLPATSIIVLYLIVMLLETNHSTFATIIVISNSVPFMSISLITGGLIALGSYFSLAFTNMGLIGLVLVQGIVQLAYNNWKWPVVVCKEYGIGFFEFIYESFVQVFVKLNSIKR